MLGNKRNQYQVLLAKTLFWVSISATSILSSKNDSETLSEFKEFPNNVAYPICMGLLAGFAVIMYVSMIVVSKLNRLASRLSQKLFPINVKADQGDSKYQQGFYKDVHANTMNFGNKYLTYNYEQEENRGFETMAICPMLHNLCCPANCCRNHAFNWNILDKSCYLLATNDIPSKEKIDELKDEDGGEIEIGLIVTLCMDPELSEADKLAWNVEQEKKKKEEQKKVAHVHYKEFDDNFLPNENFMEFFLFQFQLACVMKKQEKYTLVHCRGGHGRTFVVQFLNYFFMKIIQEYEEALGEGDKNNFEVANLQRLVTDEKIFESITALRKQREHFGKNFLHCLFADLVVEYFVENKDFAQPIYKAYSESGNKSVVFKKEFFNYEEEIEQIRTNVSLDEENAGSSVDSDKSNDVTKESESSWLI